MKSISHVTPGGLIKYFDKSGQFLQLLESVPRFPQKLIREMAASGRFPGNTFTRQEMHEFPWFNAYAKLHKDPYRDRLRYAFFPPGLTYEVDIMAAILAIANWKNSTPIDIVLSNAFPELYTDPHNGYLVAEACRGSAVPIKVDAVCASSGAHQYIASKIKKTTLCVQSSRFGSVSQGTWAEHPTNALFGDSATAFIVDGDAVESKGYHLTGFHHCIQLTEKFPVVAHLEDTRRMNEAMLPFVLNKIQTAGMLVTHQPFYCYDVLPKPAHTTYCRYGNISHCSAPASIYDAIGRGKLHAGDVLISAPYGAGISCFVTVEKVSQSLIDSVVLGLPEDGLCDALNKSARDFTKNF